MTHLLLNKRILDRNFISVAVNCNQVLTDVHDLNLKKPVVISPKLISSGL